MNKTISAILGETNARLYSIYFGRAMMETSGLQPGLVSVLIRDRPGVTAQGTITAYGNLSGMARLYSALDLKAGDTVTAEVVSPGQIQVTEVKKPGEGVGGVGPATTSSPAVPVARPPAAPVETVFVRQGLRPIHIELFNPENLNRWEPETEADVYMAFGVLQEYTQFRYCCGTSKSLLDRLGFKAETKPDAILVKEDNQEYTMAEFKMQSSTFSLNHKPDEVDVLVVWDHDEPDATKLPPVVVSLREIARDAAQELIRG